MDARSDEEKSKQISWTHALREIVINCYKFHGRDDLLPKFTEEEEVKRVPVARKVRSCEDQDRSPVMLCCRSPIIP